MKKCDICKEQQSKYKCPKCEIPYCSVACYKSHKNDVEICQRLSETKVDTEMPATCRPRGYERKTNNIIKSEDSNDEDKVSPELLEKLGQSDHLKSMLYNEHLQDLIKKIDSSSNPDTALKEAMQLPIFSEFSDACLNIVQPSYNTPHLELPGMKPDQIVETIISSMIT